MKRILNSTALVCLVFSLGSCSKDDTPSIQPYTVPTTYNFSNVEYKESASRVSMSLGFGSYLSKATTRQLSQDTINNLWNNVSASFTSEIVVNLPYAYDALNTSGNNLSGKMIDPTIFKAFADSMVVMSQKRNNTGSQGVAGKVGSRLVNYRGLEFNQLVVKGFFGALSINNVVAMLNKVATDDNNTVVTGTGTAMQHDWDLAFGYIGLPTTYDSAINYTQAPYNTSPDRPLGIGGYFFERARPIKAGGTVFEAFRKGRAAIGAKDYAVRDAAIKTIKEYLEKTLAASAYAYLSLSKTRTADADRFHDFSEATGFMLSLKYRPTSLLTAQAYQEIVDALNLDFWTLSDASLLNARVTTAQTKLVAAYGKLD
ncbi:MAG: DUF4856 domain-containing protein [Chitinophagaceae bacterium]